MRLKRAISIVGILVLLAGLAIVLSGCGKASISERAVVDDLIEVNGVFQEFDMENTNWEVTKRQTNLEDKADYIWITITADCDFFSYTVDYTAEYVLYNDGWLLEDYKVVDYRYGHIVTVDEATVAHDLMEYDTRLSGLAPQLTGQTLISRSPDISAQLDIISISVDYECDDCFLTAEYIAYYGLDLNGWHLTDAGFLGYSYVAKASSFPQEAANTEIVNGFAPLHSNFQDPTFESSYDGWANQIDLYYSAHRVLPCFVFTAEFRYTYAYTLSLETGYHGWEFLSADDGRITACETDLVGVWSYKDNDVDLSIDILSAEFSNKTEQNGYEDQQIDVEVTYTFTGLPVYWLIEHKKGSSFFGSNHDFWEQKLERRSFVQSTPIQLHLEFHGVTVNDTDPIEEYFRDSSRGVSLIKFEGPTLNDRTDTRRLCFCYSSDRSDGLYLEYERPGPRVDKNDNESEVLEVYYTLKKD